AETPPEKFGFNGPLGECKAVAADCKALTRTLDFDGRPLYLTWLFCGDAPVGICVVASREPRSVKLRSATCENKCPAGEGRHAILPHINSWPPPLDPATYFDLRAVVQRLDRASSPVVLANQCKRAGPKPGMCRNAERDSWVAKRRRRKPPQP